MTVHERSTAERGPHILLLEDNDADAELIKWELRRAQLDSVRATAEEDFRAAFQSTAPDRILSDFQLPGFDGFDALMLDCQFESHVPQIRLEATVPADHALSREIDSGGSWTYALVQIEGRRFCRVHDTGIQHHARQDSIDNEDQQTESFLKKTNSDRR